MSNKGITIHFKTKILKSGKLSYYLQLYNPLTGKRQKEYLDLYIHPKPKNEFDRNHNRETKHLAESIYAKRLLEIQSNNHGFKQKKKRVISLLTFFESEMEKRISSESGKTDIKEAISNISKELRFSFQESELRSVEIGFNFIMSYPVMYYLKMIDFAGRYSKEPFYHNQTIRFVLYNRQLIFYNKFKETKKNSVIPDELITNKNILRIEYRILKELKKQLRMNEVKIKDLFEDNTYRKLLRLWLENFKLIRFKTEPIMDFKPTETNMIEHLAHLHLCGEGGINESLNMLDTLLLKYPKQKYMKSRIKKRMIKIVNSSKHYKNDEFIAELNEKVFRKFETAMLGI